MSHPYVPPQSLPHDLDLLRAIGFTFGYADPDCKELDIQPPSLSSREMVAALKQYDAAIKSVLHWERKQRLSICCGGPRNGHRYRRYKSDIIAFHLARAKWAVYEVGPDGRAWFRGYATSAKKAKQLKVTGHTKPNGTA